MAQINKNKNNQIGTLIRLRDTLLPKLMSWKVRVEHENNLMIVKYAYK